MEETQERMGWADYIVVCVRQERLACEDRRPLPESLADLFHGPAKTSLTEYRRAAGRASELFGRKEWEETGEDFYKAKRLTLMESVIASRLDLSHEEKMKLIRPLMALREARSGNAWADRRAEEAIRAAYKKASFGPVPQNFDQRVSEADAILARALGVLLD